MKKITTLQQCRKIPMAKMSMIKAPVKEDIANKIKAVILGKESRGLAASKAECNTRLLS